LVCYHVHRLTDLLNFLAKLFKLYIRVLHLELDLLLGHLEETAVTVGQFIVECTAELLIFFIQIVFVWLVLFSLELSLVLLNHLVNPI